MKIREVLMFLEDETLNAPVPLEQQMMAGFPPGAQSASIPSAPEPMPPGVQRMVPGHDPNPITPPPSQPYAEFVPAPGQQRQPLTRITPMNRLMGYITGKTP
jgi:hypothetical protein